ncbi:MAG: aminoglycoside phosphotransferase family protein [Coxiellaceae bacterium]|nr:aminoglycoside phosphotransferase family protein [Coxiellaceae bacterium]
MMNAPIITSDKAYKNRCADTAFWQPYVSSVLQRHNLAADGTPITAGFNSTYPVFITGDLVIKFFGYRNNWQAVFKNEMAAHRCLATNPDIKAPQIIASGELFEDTESPWAYSIARRIPGNSWLNTPLTRKQQIDLIKNIGQQLKLVHALPVSNQLKTDHNWSSLDLKAAARKSVLPDHLIAQIDDFIIQLDPFDTVFVNSDIVAMHVFVNNAQLSGIIDWGDATVADRHYELGKLCLEFPGDKELLKTLLDASNWPVSKNFANQSLGLALYRQAVGLTQHNTFDVFYKIPQVITLDEITNLNELANQLFNIK